MKKILYALFCVLLCQAGTAQDSTVALSRFESFSNSQGSAKKTELQQLGTINRLRVARARTTDLSTGDSRTAVYIAPNSFGYDNQPSIRIGAYFIDPEDTDSLLHALQLFAREMKKGNTSLIDFTLSYTTSNDIRFFVSYNHNAMSPWNLYIGQQFRYLRSMVPGSVSSIGRREIDDLIFLIQAAAKPF